MPIFNKYAGRLLKRVLLDRRQINLYLYNEHSNKIIKIMKSIYADGILQMYYGEAYIIAVNVMQAQKIDGDMAEVGVYAGGSAKIICEFKKDKQLHLFDTFEGLPTPGENDIISSSLYKGEYAASLKSVKEYLKEYKRIKFYKGVFPETINPVKNKKFSFVNLDVDLYKSTKDCIKFFYPRMTKGGIIMSHDYSSPEAAGVKKAFDEFFKNKPEPIIELPGCQCIVVKT